MCLLEESTLVAVTVRPCTCVSFEKTLPMFLLLYFLYLYLKFDLLIAAVLKKHREDQLVPLLHDSGAIVNNSAQL